MRINKLVGVVIGLALLAGPAIGLAETSASSSTQVQAMLAQIQALQAQIQALKTAQTQVQTAAGNVGSTLSLIRNLRQGMSGDDVAALQAILASDPTIYPQGTISGFYGGLTAEAVKKFQKKHGFETVGFVGPKTLKKLNEEFGRLGLSFENSSSTIPRRDDDRDEGKGQKLCIPPGHLIAPGWQKKESENREDKNKGKGNQIMNPNMVSASSTNSLIPVCRELPKGIKDKLENGWMHGTSTPPVPPPAPTDVTAPVISSVGTSNLLGTTTNIVWTTNEVSNSRVWFGTSTPVSTSGSANVSDGAFVTSHSLPLSGLSTSTTYYYIVGSSDGGNNSTTSAQSSFVTTIGL